MRKLVTLATFSVAVGSALALVSPASAAAATTGFATSWSLSYGTASATGTTELVQVGFEIGSRLVVDLKNADARCYSLWAGTGTSMSKKATVCGAATTPVDFTILRTFGSPNARLCGGQVDQSDCSAPKPF